MKIYVGHSTSFDFKKELYEPIRALKLLDGVEVILPHEDSMALKSSEELIRNIDFIIAEVSYASTGLGIELGWAHAAGRPIICIHHIEAKPSSALTAICDEFFSYGNSEELKKIVANSIASRIKSR